MGAENLLDLRRIDVLAAAVDHVAFAVDEMRGSRPRRAGRCRPPCNNHRGRLRRSSRAASSNPETRKASAHRSRRARRRRPRSLAIEELDPAGAGHLAADRAEPGELFLRVEEGDPAGLGRAVAFVEPRVPEILHERQLGLAARGRRRDQELGDAADVRPRFSASGKASIMM